MSDSPNGPVDRGPNRPLTGPALDIARDVRAGSRSAAQVVEKYLGAIDDIDGELHAFVTVLHDAARQRAADIDQAVADGTDPGLMSGDSR